MAPIGATVRVLGLGVGWVRCATEQVLSFGEVIFLSVEVWPLTKGSQKQNSSKAFGLAGADFRLNCRLT
jgi:hypothetical protein